MSRRQHALEKAIEAAERTATSSGRLLQLCRKQQQQEAEVLKQQQVIQSEQLKREGVLKTKNEEILKRQEKQHQQLRDELMKREDELLQQLNSQVQNQKDLSLSKRHSLSAISPIRKPRKLGSYANEENKQITPEFTSVQTPPRVVSNSNMQTAINSKDDYLSEEDWDLSPAPKVLKKTSVLRSLSPERPRVGVVSHQTSGHHRSTIPPEHNEDFNVGHHHHRSTLPPGNEDSFIGSGIALDLDTSRLSIDFNTKTHHSNTLPPSNDQQYASRTASWNKSRPKAENLDWETSQGPQDNSKWNVKQLFRVSPTRRKQSPKNHLSVEIKSNKGIAEDTLKWNNSHISTAEVIRKTVDNHKVKSPPVRNHFAAVTKAASNFLSPPPHIRELISSNKKSVSPIRLNPSTAMAADGGELITREQLISRGILKTISPVRKVKSN